MAGIHIDNVSKRFRRSTNRAGVMTLKSLFTRDYWSGQQTRKRVNQFYALQDISADVAAGEAFGIIGRNGAGKSTLLKLVTRIIRPDAGSIRVNGSVAALIELGAGFHPELTGRENVIINGIILGETKRSIRAKVDSIIDFAEIRDFIDEPVRVYSSGMYMRLAFAVAICVDPDILLIDEVLSVGDAAFKSKCLVRMNQFKKQGKALLLVSHDLGHVASWCDRVMWLDGGKCRLIGPAAEVVEAYLNTVEVAPGASSEGSGESPGAATPE